MLLPASAASSVSESGFSHAISAGSSRSRPDSTFAKLSMKVNQTAGSPQAIAIVRAFIRFSAGPRTIYSQRSPNPSPNSFMLSGSSCSQVRPR